ncbi:MAG: histidinol phosphate phosphatase domain-containing protein [Thermodesulfobacteriota bacterium]
MIDFHSHTLLSDGYLLPSELAQRAQAAGYKALAFTDHADDSNLETVLTALLRVTERLNRCMQIKVLAGVELTHIPPRDIPFMVKKARVLGARIIIGHGETLAEPVARGSNRAYIRAGVDILAHPGLVTEAEARLAVKRDVRFEITTRAGHSISNGHVAGVANKCGVKMVLDTDTHSPSDITTLARAEKVALGAGLGKRDFKKIQKNALELLDKTLS